METPLERIENLKEEDRELKADIERLTGYNGTVKRHYSKWFTDVEEAARDPMNCTDLDLTSQKGKKLTTLPEEIRDLYHLERLYLSRNNIREIPNWIGDLQELRSISLYGNKIAELPEALRALKNLKKIDMEKNELTIVPEWISELSNLEYIDFSRNNIAYLPECMKFLKKITYLDLRGNLIREPPEWLPELTELQYSNFEPWNADAESEASFSENDYDDKGKDGGSESDSLDSWVDPDDE